MAKERARLHQALEYKFSNPRLLDEALTHPSALQGRQGRASGRGGYERLEFLGDRVLGLVVAEMLFNAFPNENEGALARRHAALVRREALARVAAEIGLGACLAMSRGEEETGGRNNPTLLADACEAVIGALYADAGLDVAASFVRRHWEPLMGEALTPPKDAKTALQEWAQGLGRKLPLYTTLGMEGPPHEPIFLVEVMVEGVESVTGRGTSKRAAEQAAAQAMLEKVKS
ncbi:ribonuclease III [Telmatospirillum sp. J64-1]|uniref:ribonuclease III n=1 Tax=Telmatospirillum sp. J64-1 TaxID=2502183 RepID=UPI00115DAC16|nr:ribonuclease III [Telmatospirillum sp. J64-1]